MKYSRVNQLTKRIDKVIEAEEEYINSLPDYDLWISHTDAVVGSTYDVENDRIIPIKPHNSWVYDSDNNIWNPPVDYPSDYSSRKYVWVDDDEEFVYFEDLPEG